MKNDSPRYYYDTGNGVYVSSNGKQLFLYVGRAEPLILNKREVRKLFEYICYSSQMIGIQDTSAYWIHRYGILEKKYRLALLGGESQDEISGD